MALSTCLLLVAVLLIGALTGNLLSRVGKLEEVADPAALSLFEEPADLEAFITKVGKSVVTIHCNGGNGTGFAYDLEGLDVGYKTFIVTNQSVIYNCVDQETSLSVTYGGDKRLESDVKIFGWDGLNDLALLEISAALPVLKDATNYSQPGEWTMAIGNQEPNDVILHNATTFGRIIAHEDQYRIYTSAFWDPGNSGGPLVNSRGELIGVNNSYRSSFDYGIMAVDAIGLCEKVVECP